MYELEAFATRHHYHGSQQKQNVRLHGDGGMSDLVILARTPESYYARADHAHARNNTCGPCGYVIVWAISTAAFPSQTKKIVDR